MKNYRVLLNKSIGKKEMIETMLKEKTEVLDSLTNKTIHIEQAQVIIQDTAKATQEKLRFHIEDIVQLALDAIYPHEYIFNLEFVIKRGKTEAEICFLKNDNKINPMEASGGGVVDVASFALRIAIWSISNTDNIMILDEPGKWISKDLIPKFALIIKELSEKLNLQFIIVTHITELTETADKIFNVVLKKGISEVKEVKSEIGV